jgi:cystathionine gamma-synthase
MLHEGSNVKAFLGGEHLPPTLLRLSVGIEAVDDFWIDLDQALRNTATGI